MPRYIDITLCRHVDPTPTTTNVTTVKRIDYRASTKRLASSGDGDKQDTFLAKGMEGIQGSIVLEDPVQAAALLALLEGILTFKGTQGNTLNLTDLVTITNVQFFEDASGLSHDDIGGCAVSFMGTALTTVAST